jgi:hypothetical protein
MVCSILEAQIEHPCPQIQSVEVKCRGKDNSRERKC